LKFHYHSKRQKDLLAVNANICNARCITNADLEEGICLEKAGRHEHEATRGEIEDHQTVARIKRRAKEHPTSIIIWKFIEYLQKDQHDNNLLINQLLGGHIGVRHPIKKSYLLNLRHVEQMVGNYDD
jgi:hypothetical protein